MPTVIVKEFEDEEQKNVSQFAVNDETGFTKLITYLHYFFDVANCDDNIVEIKLKRRLQ